MVCVWGGFGQQVKSISMRSSAYMLWPARPDRAGSSECDL